MTKLRALWVKKGTYQSRNCSIYTGEWKQNLKHGKGLLNYIDGKVYEGEFVRSQKQGFGKRNN